MVFLLNLYNLLRLSPNFAWKHSQLVWPNPRDNYIFNSFSMGTVVWTMMAISSGNFDLTNVEFMINGLLAAMNGKECT